MADHRDDPPKFVITELDTGEFMECQFNPEQFDENLDVEYSRTAPKGSSHERVHYDHTGNLRHELDLVFRGRSPAERVALKAARTRLHSWAYPIPGPDGLGGAPPLLLVTWPGTLSLQVQLVSMALSATRFDADAQIHTFTAKVQFEEVRDRMLTYDDVAADTEGRFGSQ